MKPKLLVGLFIISIKERCRKLLMIPYYHYLFNFIEYLTTLQNCVRYNIDFHITSTHKTQFPIMFVATFLLRGKLSSYYGAFLNCGLVQSVHDCGNGNYFGFLW